MKAISVLTVILLVFTNSFLSAQNDEDWKSKVFEVSEFNEIYLEGGYKVFLIQGAENSVLVKASDDEVFDYLEVRDKQELLSLKINRKHFNFDRINLYITFTNLEKIKIEGGVRLQTEGYLDLDDFFLHVEGGAKVELDLKANDVKVVGEGGVLFELDGISESLDIIVSGAGHVNASELKAKDVSFKVEGVGTGVVHATETLYARIEGVGKIKYRGNPKVTKNIEGVGSVTRD